ncbi:MAG: hypothetical protein K2Q34_02285 [Alphaproteobacteria bacterium]|nr:hypothetical protein [Alphaproteobacteria bacterium]
MKSKFFPVFLLASILNIFEHAFAMDEFGSEGGACETRPIRWIDAIENRANSIREQIASGEDVTVNFCLGMCPHEAAHLNDEYLNAIYGSNQVNFFVNMAEHKHPSGVEPRAEDYPEAYRFNYQNDLQYYRESHERNVRIYSTNDSVGQEGRYLNIDLNNAEHRKEVARIFEGLVTNFIPDGNVTGYLSLSDDSLSDYLSMLRPGGKFILDSHWATGGFGVEISVDEDSLDAVQRKNSTNPIGRDENGNRIYDLKTLRKLIAGEYYRDSKDSLMRAPSIYIGTDMSHRLEPSLQKQVDDSYLTFVRGWFGSYVRYPVSLTKVTPEEAPYLSSKVGYKHRALFIIERLG